METLSTTSILSLLDTNKDQRISFADDILRKMENGEANPLKIHCQVKAMESLLAHFTDKKQPTATRYAALILEAAEKQGGKSFEFYNGKFQIKEAGTVYDWGKCEDPALTEMLVQAEALKEKIKEKQDFLKTVPAAGVMITDENTGETAKVYPPAKTSTTIVSVSIK